MDREFRTKRTQDWGDRLGFVEDQRQRLLDLMDRQVALLDEMRSMDESVEELHNLFDVVTNLTHVVESSNFKVMVMGQFKTGKSTFINALLREEVLPTDPVPCTAIINEIKFDEEKHAVLYHLPREDGTVPDPEPIGVDQLHEFVVIENSSTNQRNVKATMYDRVEVYWPLEICRHNVTIVDSPGLNENKAREKIAMDYLRDVDAILFVFSALQLGPSIYEQNAIDTLKSYGHEEIFFICNRVNQLRREADREKVRNWAQDKLTPLTALANSQEYDAIHFISALDALDGRLENDNEMVAISNIKPLEETLERFLVNRRGRLKLVRAANDLRQTIQSVQRFIPARRDMLRQGKRELEARYQAAQEPLDRLERTRTDIVEEIELTRREINTEVLTLAENHYRTIVDSIPGWLEELELENPLGFMDVATFKTKEKVEAVIHDVDNYLTMSIEGETARWQNERLNPMLQRKIERLQNQLDEDTGRFLRQVDELRLNIISPSGASAAADIVGDVSPTERVLAAAGGWFIAGPGAAGVGATLGWKHMAKGLVAQIALGVGAMVIGVTNPLVLLGVMTAGGAAQMFNIVGKLNQNIIESVGARMQSELRNSLRANSEQVANEVDGTLLNLQRNFDEGLRRELENVREEAESALRKLDDDEHSINQELQRLEAISQEIDIIAGDLDAFMMDLSISSTQN